MLISGYTRIFQWFSKMVGVGFKVIPSGKLTSPQPWKIPIFNRKYIFNPGPFFIAMLVYRRVSQDFLKPTPTQTSHVGKRY